MLLGMYTLRMKYQRTHVDKSQDISSLRTYDCLRLMKSTTATSRLAKPKNTNGIQIPNKSANMPLKKRKIAPPPN